MTDIELRSDVTVDLVKHTAADTDVLWAARVSTAGEQAQNIPDERDEDKLAARDMGLIN
ncbi:hypothetical protein [Streptomyces lavendofoliae]|uniref:Uncharacterized protein n=1 Tax=Streptomyces lavendofoliae TaxID=67314 RepID=A0A918I2F5_9ACTN|nr:hypothetical protein GCM10010274_58250 [Streptomyces lavendofoliae]